MKDMQMFYEVNGQSFQTHNIQSKQGLVNFNELTYANVYGSGIDLRLTQNTKQRKMDYLIQDQTALSNIPNGADFLVFEEKVVLPVGWTAQLINNEIILKDQAGNMMAKYEKPVFRDTPPPHNHNHGSEVEEIESHFEEMVGDYVISQSGNEIIIKTKVPVNWLTSPQRNFPLIIDPTVNYYPTAASRWTGYLRTNTVVSTTIGASSTDEIRIGKTSSDEPYNGWAKFDITSLPDASCISSSSLWYKVFDNSTTQSDCEAIVRTRHMANDPVTASKAAVLTDIRNGTIYSDADWAIKTTGTNLWRNKSLNANIDIQSQLVANWFAVGMEMYSFNSSHSTCYIGIRGQSHPDRIHLQVTYASGSSASTSATGGGTFCWGNNITLSSTGGLNGTGVAHVWYKGGCNNTLTETWNNQPYGLVSTTVNSNTNGI